MKANHYHITAETQADRRALDESLVGLARACAHRATRPVQLLCGWCRRVISEGTPPAAGVDLCTRCSGEVPS